MAEVSPAQMDLDEAATHLGLKASFLQWALNAGLLQGERSEDGDWTLSRPEIEGGEEALSQEAPLADGVSATDDDERAEPAERLTASPSAALMGPVQGARDALHQHLEKEIAYLRRQLDEQGQSLAAKDRLISDLAASLARLGETALDRLPRDG